MTPDQRDRLIFMGLVALDEARERARQGPIEGTPAIRVVLAVLYVVCGRDRHSFYAFWRALVRPADPDALRAHDAIMRSNELHTSFCCIVRALGIPDDIHLTSALAAARRTPGPGHSRWFENPPPIWARAAARARLAELLRETANEERMAKDRARQARSCDLSG